MARRMALSLTIVLLISSLGSVPMSGQKPILDGGARSLDLSRYHNYTEVAEWLGSVAENHPNIASLRVIGSTWEGRDILALRLTDNPDSEEAEPDVLIMGGHHGNELPSVEVPLYIIEHLAGNYSNDSSVRQLVDTRDIWFVPLVNPDGHEYALSMDAGWRKNRRPIDLDGDGTPEGIGVDLNRNYGHLWGLQGTSHDPASNIYCGPAPFSESECGAIESLAIEQLFELSLSYHTYGRQVSYTWNNGIDPVNPKENTLEAIAAEMAERNGYTPMEGKDLYPTTGDSDDWLYANTSCLPFTVEVGTEYAPPPWQLGALCEENLDSALYAIGIAGEPERASLPDWTVMAYMAADSTPDMETEAGRDINEMEAAGGGDDVNVIALYDGMTDGDSKIYRIKWDSAGVNQAIISDALDDLGAVIDPATCELDMADPSTLEDFVGWTVANYPAQHYLLDIWGHGKGVLEGCCLDGPHFMPIQELGAALSGFDLDIVGFDACLMGHFETAYELMGSADIFVGSEAEEPLDGWDYLKTMSSLVAAPNTGPVEVAGWIVADYLEANAMHGYGTMAAMDMHVFERDFLPLLYDFANVSFDFMYQDHGEVWEARNRTDTFTLEQDTVDLYEFLGHLAERDISESVLARVESLIGLKGFLMLESGHGPTYPLADTLGVYFPLGSSTLSNVYQDLGFASGLWEGYLRSLRDPAQRPRLVPKEFPDLDNTSGPYEFAVEVLGTVSTELFLKYRLNGGQWRSQAMNVSGGIRKAGIAGQRNGTVMDFYFLATFDGGEITEPYEVKRGSQDYFRLRVFAKCDAIVSSVSVTPDSPIEAGTQAVISVNCTNSGSEDAMVNVSLELAESGGQSVTDGYLLTLPAGKTVTVDFTWVALQGEWTCAAAIVTLEVFDTNTSNQAKSLLLNVTARSTSQVSGNEDLALIFASLFLVGMVPPLAFVLLHARVRRRRRQLARKALTQAREYIKTVEEFGVDASGSYIQLARAESAYAKGALGEAVELSRAAKESATLALGRGGRVG